MMEELSSQSHLHLARYSSAYNNPSFQTKGELLSVGYAVRRAMYKLGKYGSSPICSNIATTLREFRLSHRV